MLGKIYTAVILLAMLILSVGFFYESIPGAPVTLKANNITPEPATLIDYGSVPVFSENLRFNHNNISYYIESECDGPRREAMIIAFEKFAEKMKIISFYEVNSEADIDVGCSDDYIPMGENLFAAGEGGPSRIINTSMFKTIEKGKISLYSDPQCEEPIVETHELGHVFGFDHSLDPKNIMYNISKCNQKISEDMIKLINDLYSIDPLGDASVSNLSAVIRGKYLDFNITILNEGLIDIDSVNLTIIVDDKILQVMDIGGIGIGYGRTMKATNVRLPSRNVDVIDFIVDKEDSVQELNEENNAVQMVI